MQSTRATAISDDLQWKERTYSCASIRVTRDGQDYCLTLGGSVYRFPTRQALRSYLLTTEHSVFSVDDATRNTAYCWHFNGSSVGRLTDGQLQRRLALETGGAWVERRGADMRYMIEQRGWFTHRYEEVDAATFGRYIGDQARPNWLTALGALAFGAWSTWLGGAEPALTGMTPRMLAALSFVGVQGIHAQELLTYAGPIARFDYPTSSRESLRAAVEGFVRIESPYTTNENTTIQYFQEDLTPTGNASLPGTWTVAPFNSTYTLLMRYEPELNGTVLHSVGDPSMPVSGPSLVDMNGLSGTPQDMQLYPLDVGALLWWRMGGGVQARFYVQPIGSDRQPSGPIRQVDIQSAGYVYTDLPPMAILPRSDGYTLLIGAFSLDAVHYSLDWEFQSGGYAFSTWGQYGVYVNGRNLSMPYVGGTQVTILQFEDSNDTTLPTEVNIPLPYSSQGTIIYPRTDGGFILRSSPLYEGQRYSSIWQPEGDPFTMYGANQLVDLTSSNFLCFWTDVGSRKAQIYGADSSLSIFPPGWREPDALIESAAGLHDLNPDVAALPPPGEVGIVWQRHDPQADRGKVMWQRFHVLNGAIGDPVELSSFSYDQRCPVATGTGRGAHFAWQTFGRDGEGWGIAAAAVTTEMPGALESHTVNAGYEGDQTDPLILGLGDESVVAFSDVLRSSMQRLNSSAQRAGTSTTIGEVTTGSLTPGVAGDFVRGLVPLRDGFAVARLQVIEGYPSHTITPKLQYFRPPLNRSGPDRDILEPVVRGGKPSGHEIVDVAPFNDGVAVLVGRFTGVNIDGDAVRTGEIHLFNRDGLRTHESPAPYSSSFPAAFRLRSNGTHLELLHRGVADGTAGSAIFTQSLNSSGSPEGQPAMLDGFLHIVSSSCRTQLPRSAMTIDGHRVTVWHRRRIGESTPRIAVRVDMNVAAPKTEPDFGATSDGEGTRIMAMASDGIHQTPYLGTLAMAVLGMRMVA